MIFRYFKYKEPDGSVVRLPLLPINLKCNRKKVDLFGLVDSGSDISLFHSSLAKLLNIDIKTGKHLKIYTIGGAALDIYIHQVHLTVIGLGTGVDTMVGFTESTGGLRVRTLRRACRFKHGLEIMI